MLVNLSLAVGLIRAVRTREPLATAVGGHVFLQVRVLDAAVRAEGACDGLLTGMGEHVSLEVARPSRLI